MKYQKVYLPNGRKIKIPKDHVCFAMDANGCWFSYKFSIVPSQFQWSIVGSDFSSVKGLSGPFEPGHWTTQIYWVGEW